MWNFSHAQTTLRASFFIWQYLCSVLVSDLLAYAIGLHIPFLSITDVGLSMEKCASWRSEARTCLMLSNDFCFSGVHMNGIFFRVSSQRGSNNLVRWGMKSDKYLTIPRKLGNSVMLFGGLNAWFAAVLLSLGYIPSLDILNPKKTQFHPLRICISLHWQ